MLLLQIIYLSPDLRQRHSDEVVVLMVLDVLQEMEEEILREVPAVLKHLADAIEDVLAVRIYWGVLKESGFRKSNLEQIVLLNRSSVSPWSLTTLRQPHANNTHSLVVAVVAVE